MKATFVGNPNIGDTILEQQNNYTTQRVEHKNYWYTLNLFINY
jgi:hypothetical protein